MTRTATTLVVTLLMTLACLTGCGSSEDRNPASTPFDSAAGSTGNRNPGGGEATDCASATQRVRDDYASVRSCQSDADCNYVSGFTAQGEYMVHPRTDTDVTVPTQDCSTGAGQVLYLVVANGAKVRDGEAKIKADVQAQQSVCAAENPGTVRCQSFSSETYTSAPRCNPASATCEVTR